MSDFDFLALVLRTSNMASLIAFMLSGLLLAKSILDFSHSGPPLAHEVLQKNRLTLVLSLARLMLAAFLLASLLALPGCLAYSAGLAMFGQPYQPVFAALAALISLFLLVTLQFCRVLHDSPGVIVASSHYAMSRFYPLWERLSPSRLRLWGLLILLLYLGWMLLGIGALFMQGAVYSAIGLLLMHGLAYLVLLRWAVEREPVPMSISSKPSRPNLLMIGSDTLRADRLGIAGYRRALTPNLDRLAAKGATLTHCYVPCARTAPSLLSMFTGTWPHTHGVRDNFASDAESHITQDALPHLLAHAGYRTAAVGDWAASDLSKFNLGFELLDVPADQWNLKFLMRQGPKDIRLFLSLFMANAIGKYFLEEIYFLGGVPRTRQVGLRARQMIEELSSDSRPFFLNVFMASTHPPFASNYPYYTMFADPAYRGPSKFAMARLTDPFEIIRRQAEPREEFDLEQILDLYDGCVKSFDDELGQILEYLESIGLAQDTLVVVYSDHGMEFFEHGTWGQGNSAIGDFSARIPVVIAGSSLPADTQIDEVTRSIDLAPTILELLGLQPVASMEGVSLVNALNNGELPELPAFYETGIWLTTLPGMPEAHLSYPGVLELLDVPDLSSGTLALKKKYQNQIYAAKDRMVRCGRWKLVYQPLIEGKLLRLYDVAKDPGCQNDVAANEPDVTSRLWELLQGWMAQDQLSQPALQDKNGTKD
jgi:arylsulfatase A-like enzyme